MGLKFPLSNPKNYDTVLDFIQQSTKVLDISDNYTHSALSDTFEFGIISDYSLEKNSIVSNNRSFRGVYYVESTEDPALEQLKASMVISLTTFSILLTAEVLKINQKNPELRRNILRNAILNYVVNAYFTSNNFVQQPPLTQEQYDNFKAKLVNQPKLIDDVVADGFQTAKRQQQFDFTHALFLYAFKRIQEDSPLATEILDTIYEFLFSYGFGAIYLGTYATIFVLLRQKLGFNLTHPLLQLKDLDNYPLFVQAHYITSEYTSDSRGSLNNELAELGRAWHQGTEGNFATFAQKQQLLSIFDYIEFDPSFAELEEPLEAGSAPLVEQVTQAFAGPIKDFFNTPLVNANQALEAAKEINNDYLKYLNVNIDQYQKLRLKNAQKVVNPELVEKVKARKKRAEVRDGTSAYRKFKLFLVLGLVLVFVYAFITEYF
ncbi:hypothetical protein [Psittacicella gerlachiana]|uniref:Uncharacterized protein n=1 Tax=Psittacicella gerlachiana TaxID=2028574 RepID=A0A3A1YFN3_9GAMM|nr:hypothetical protein [Psittacicella gerlachiana]RIY34847.1 hypothetical protein CKF59_04620 [Psittacicella gerlachiana]